MKKGEKINKNSQTSKRLATNVDNSLFNWVQERAAHKGVSEAAYLRMMLIERRQSEDQGGVA